MLSCCQNTNCDACPVVTKWCQNTFIDLLLRERKQFCDGKVSLHLMCVKVPCEKRKWRHMDSFLFLRQNIFSKEVNNGEVHLDQVVISHWEYVSEMGFIVRLSFGYEATGIVSKASTWNRVFGTHNGFGSMYPTIQYWKKKKTMKELGLRGCLWWDILRHVSLQRKGARCIYKSRMLSLNESCEITQLNTYNTLFSEMRLFFFLSFLRSCELRSPPEVFKVSLIYQLRSQASQMLMVFQVYSFGLPEKVGTGQDGPDFLQWDGWEGGIMPKQVLFCLF